MYIIHELYITNYINTIFLNWIVRIILALYVFVEFIHVCQLVFLPSTIHLDKMFHHRVHQRYVATPLEDQADPWGNRS